MQLPLLLFQILRERTDRPTGHKNCPSSSSLPFPISTPEWEGFRKLFLFLLAPPFISLIFLFFSFSFVCLRLLFARPTVEDRGEASSEAMCVWLDFFKKNLRRRLFFSLPFFFLQSIMHCSGKSPCVSHFLF